MRYSPRRATMLVYRLEDSQNELPKHWAYCDAWEINTDPRHKVKYIDNRRPGFQTWPTLGVIAVAAELAFSDGEYSAKEYPWFHVIEASNVYDGADVWFAVRTEDVVTVKVVETVKLVEWAKTQWNADVAAGYDYEDDFKSWCEDSEDEILDWLSKNTTSVTPNFIETLENPYV